MFLAWLRYRTGYIYKLKILTLEKGGFEAKAKSLCPMLNNIRIYFSEEKAIFVSSKKITHLDFQSSFGHYRKC